MGPISLRQRILSSQKAFRGGAVPFSFAVLLEGVGNGNGPIAEVLPIHCFDRSVRSLEARVVDEGEAL